MGSSVFLQTSVEWHCPDPSTVIFANGSGKPAVQMSAYLLTSSRHDKKGINCCNTWKKVIINISEQIKNNPFPEKLNLVCSSVWMQILDNGQETGDSGDVVFVKNVETIMDREGIKMH